MVIDPKTGEVFERRRERPRVYVPLPGPDEGSIVQQNARDECDINRIVAQYGKTGQLTHFAALAAKQGDFVQAPDFQEAMTLVVEAQQRFDSLPAKVRKRFGNDPAALLEFMGDGANLEEARKLGLVRQAETSQGAPQAPRGALDGAKPSDPPSSPSAPSEGAPKPS